jgi:hypothetical protein
MSAPASEADHSRGLENGSFVPGGDAGKVNARLLVCAQTCRSRQVLAFIRKDDRGTYWMSKASPLFRTVLAVTGISLYLTSQAQQAVTVERLIDRAIIGPDLHPSIGRNIQGPSLIRVPDWIESPLGRYYLYFADHKGAYIRLAFADELKGPWQIHEPGSLQIVDSYFLTTPPELSPERQAEIQTEPPRFYRRLVSLSQAAMADSSNCS